MVNEFKNSRVAHAQDHAGQSPRCFEAAVRLCRSDTAGTRCDSIFQKMCRSLAHSCVRFFTWVHRDHRVLYLVPAIAVGIRIMGQSSSNTGHSGECRFYIRIRNCVLSVARTFFRVALHAWHVSTARALDFAASSCASFVDFFRGIASFPMRTFSTWLCFPWNNASFLFGRCPRQVRGQFEVMSVGTPMQRLYRNRLLDTFLVSLRYAALSCLLHRLFIECPPFFNNL